MPGGPDHDGVAVDRHGVAEAVARRGVGGRQLVDLHVVVSCQPPPIRWRLHEAAQQGALRICVGCPELDCCCPRDLSKTGHDLFATVDPAAVGALRKSSPLIAAQRKSSSLRRPRAPPRRGRKPSARPDDESARGRQKQPVCTDPRVERRALVGQRPTQQSLPPSRARTSSAKGSAPKFTSTASPWSRPTPGTAARRGLFVVKGCRRRSRRCA